MQRVLTIRLIPFALEGELYNKYNEQRRENINVTI